MLPLKVWFTKRRRIWSHSKSTSYWIVITWQYLFSSHGVIERQFWRKVKNSHTFSTTLKGILPYYQGKDISFSFSIAEKKKKLSIYFFYCSETDTGKQNTCRVFRPKRISVSFVVCLRFLRKDLCQQWKFLVTYSFNPLTRMNSMRLA